MRRLFGVAIFACLVLGTTVPAGAVGQPSGARPGVVRSTTWLLRNSLSGGAAEVQFDFGLTGDQKLMGDWNGDGIETIGFHRGAYWHLRNANGPGASALIVRFGDLSTLDADALPALITELRRRGYGFTTIRQDT